MGIFSRFFKGPPAPEPPLPLRLLLEAVQASDPHARLVDGQVHLSHGITLGVEHIETFRFDNGKVRTATVTTAKHPTLFAEGLVEFQHAMGADESTAISNGFRSWTQMDLVTLLDAVQADPAHCAVMEITLPASDQAPEAVRQIVLGPIARYGAQPMDADEEHPFCPCCLFTRSLEAFMPVLRAEQFLGVRLFASRADDGSFSADCRINGNDYPDALPALIEYAGQWQGNDTEFRKQYVIIRPKP